MKFLHSADWQLGKPYGRFEPDLRSALTEARFDAIDALGRAAVEHGVGHVLVAGDIFDTEGPEDRTIVQAVSRMGRYGLKWWLLPGNHDFARNGGLWDRVRKRAGEEIVILTEPVPHEIEPGVWLLPAPLIHRHNLEDPTAQFDTMATPGATLRIGLAHGSIRDFGSQGETRNQIAPDRARRSILDYLALGDWHGTLKVDPRTWYAGTPETDRFQRDDPGHALLVDLAAGRAPEVTPLRTGRYQWLQRDWLVNDRAAFESECNRLLSDVDPAATLLQLTLAGITCLTERVGMLAHLQDDLSHRLRFLDLRADNLVGRPANAKVNGLEELKRRHGAAIASRDKAQQALDRAQERRKSVAGRLVEGRQRVTDTRSMLEEARQARQAAKAALSAGEQLAAARRRGSAAIAARARHAELLELEAERRNAKALADTAIPAKSIDKLEVLVRALAEARAVVNAGATLVTFSGPIGLVLVDGEPVTAGERALTRATTFSFGEASLTVTPPRTAESAEETLAAAKRELMAALEELGVGDIAGARSRNEAARDAAAEIRTLDARIKAATPADPAIDLIAGPEALKLFVTGLDGANVPAQGDPQALFGSAEAGMALQDPHQHGVGMVEVVELPLQLVCPLLAMEEVVAEPPDDEQHRKNSIARSVRLARDTRLDEIRHIPFSYLQLVEGERELSILEVTVSKVGHLVVIEFGGECVRGVPLIYRQCNLPCAAFGPHHPGLKKAP